MLKPHCWKSVIFLYARFLSKSTTYAAYGSRSFNEIKSYYPITRTFDSVNSLCWSAMSSNMFLDDEY